MAFSFARTPKKTDAPASAAKMMLTAVDAVRIMFFRAFSRRLSRRHRSSKSTPRSPAASLAHARERPSFLRSRPSGSIGSACGSSGSAPARSNCGKHSVSGSPEFGVPSMMTAKIFPSRPVLRKWRISAATHFDLAERGEQMTIRLSDASMERSTIVAMLAAAAISSSSRKKRPRRREGGKPATIPSGTR